MFWNDHLDALWRFPDKMNEHGPEKLAVYEGRGGFVAQQKLDGYRAVIMGDDSQVVAMSRHRKPLAVSPEVLKRFLELELPEPWMLDAEWVKLRTGTPETVFLLDSFYLEGDWVGSAPLDVREGYFYCTEYPEGISVPNCAKDNFIDFMAEQITDGNPKEAVSEGVVIKKVNATLIGDRKKSEKNPGWAKIKWRAGEGGDTPILAKEQLKELKNVHSV